MFSADFESASSCRRVVDRKLNNITKVTKMAMQGCKKAAGMRVPPVREVYHM